MTPSVFTLPLPERIKLVEALWDSIAVEQTALLISTKHKQELDLRLTAYANDGIKGRLSDDVINDIWKKL